MISTFMLSYVLVSIQKIKNFDYNVSKADESHFDLQQQDDLPFNETQIMFFHVIKKFDKHVPYDQDLTLGKGLERYLNLSYV